MHPSPSVRARRAALLASALLALAACASPGTATDKGGGRVRTLHFVDATGINPNHQDVTVPAFLAALSTVSGGKLVAEVTQKFEDGQPAAESDLVTAVRDGRFDGGWPAARAFARAGIPALEPLESPLTITSYEAERAIAAGPARDAVLAALQGTGLVGLGVTVGPLRRPWSDLRPLLGPDDWRGATFRVFHSDTQQETVSALGGVPVDASYHFPDLVRAHQLHGAEIDVAQYRASSYATLLPYATSNVVLWPRMSVLVLNQSTYDSLSAEQKQWISTAADHGVQAGMSFPYDDDAVARQLCNQGVRFLAASAAQLRQLAEAVRPVQERLASDGRTAAVYRAVLDAVAAHRGIEALDVPASCRTAS